MKLLLCSLLFFSNLAGVSLKEKRDACRLTVLNNTGSIMGYYPHFTHIEPFKKQLLGYCCQSVIQPGGRAADFSQHVTQVLFVPRANAPDDLLVVHPDEIRLWEIPIDVSGEQRKPSLKFRIPLESDVTQRCALSSVERSLIVKSLDDSKRFTGRLVGVWDLSTGEPCDAPLDVDDVDLLWPMQELVSPLGHRAVVKDNTIEVSAQSPVPMSCSLNPGFECKILGFRDYSISSIAFSSDGSLLACTGNGESTIVFRLCPSLPPLSINVLLNWYMHSFAPDQLLPDEKRIFDSLPIGAQRWIANYPLREVRSEGVIRDILAEMALLSISQEAAFDQAVDIDGVVEDQKNEVAEHVDDVGYDSDNEDNWSRGSGSGTGSGSASGFLSSSGSKEGDFSEDSDTEDSPPNILFSL